MTAPSPKPRREVRVDLSGLTDRQVLVRQHVVSLGERAYGPRWQSDLAVALTKEAGRRVGQSQVSQWVSGSRPVPEGLLEPLQRLAFKVVADLERRADAIRADWIASYPDEDVEAASRA